MWVKVGAEIVFRFIVSNITNDTLNIAATSGDGGLVISHYSKGVLLPKESEEMFYIFYTKGRLGLFAKTMTINYSIANERDTKHKTVARVIRGQIE